MRPPITSATRITHRASGDASSPRTVPEETPVALSYGGTTHAVMMATPADLQDFTYGFTLTEGIIAAPEEIEAIEIEQAGAGIDIQIRLKDRANTRFEARRRRLAGPVGCGLCGIESIDEAMRAVPAIGRSGLTLGPEDIALAVRLLAEQQPFHGETGAVHAAGCYVPQAILPPPLTPPRKGEGELETLRPDRRELKSPPPSPLRGGVRGGGPNAGNCAHSLNVGQIIAAREDVGRHNALDKLAGALAGIDGASGAVVVTSRVSVEMIQKPASIGAPFILAVSAPTALAIRTAEAAGITLVALVRGDEFDIFTHPERILSGAKADVA